jgi:hypothetical protein
MFDRITYNDAVILQEALDGYIRKAMVQIDKANNLNMPDLAAAWRIRGEAAIRLKEQVDLDLD